jgi:hypothetical protein
VNARLEAALAITRTKVRFEFISNTGGWKWPLYLVRMVGS